MHVIDLNADLGEAVGEAGRRTDALLLDVVSSANVACGFHAGDADVMRRTCDAAAARNVVIGAHVSYRDREGFGRRDIEIPPEQLTDELLEQLVALESIARAAGAPCRYVKAHGALYNRCAHDPAHAGAVVRALQQHDRPLGLLVAPGSVLQQRAATAGIAVFAEGFVDRAYRRDGTLVARREPHAVHATVAQAVAQAVELARDGTVRTEHGDRIALVPQSLCVHGDTPHAVDTARAVRDGLRDAGIAIHAFV